MATTNQFNKGETINITVRPTSEETFTDPVLYVYPESLDLRVEPQGSDYIRKITGTPGERGVVGFSIPPSDTGSEYMPAGDYTVELKYGTGDDISIVRTNKAFTLVESGYNTFGS